MATRGIIRLRFASARDILKQRRPQLSNEQLRKLDRYDLTVRHPDAMAVSAHFMSFDPSLTPQDRK